MLLETNTNNMCATSLALGKHAIDKLFQPAPIEQDVRLQYVDIPKLHMLNSPIGTGFVESLSSSENMGLFETTVIKKLVEFQWPVVLKYTVLKLLVPYACFLLFFSCYIHLKFHEDNDFLVPETKILFMAPLALVSAYLLMIEARQLARAKLGYFMEVWNYLDIVPPVMIFIYMFLDLQGFFDRVINEAGEDVTPNYIIVEQASMKGIMSLFVWLKFLYFLRIFEKTGYLIRSIVLICIDMRHFLLILMLTFIAFGEAIQSVSETRGDKSFTGHAGGIGYVYTMVLGGFDVGDFDDDSSVTLLWIFFILCTVLCMIIMMNLLIAIISDSFAAITAVASQANYRERAKIISENLYLVPEAVKNSYTSPNSYLLMAIDTQAEIESKEVSIDEKIKELRQNLKEHNNEHYVKLKDRLKRLQTEIQNHLGVGPALASKLGGSRFGGSIRNAPHGNASSHHH
jgi:hypothetical protein